MLKIKQISIKNFRSIKGLTLDVADINVYSGLNDVGKSNILKALNLFFNGQTDLGCEYNFQTDYCVNAPIAAKKEKRIEIALQVEIPSNFKDAGVVTWKKVWNKEGLKSDKKGNKDFSLRSKAGMLFQRVKYRYVPAVKSRDYFKSLLKDLYDSLASDVDSELAKRTLEYSETIKTYTKGISNILKSRFDINSSLEYPHDQSVVFRELQFMTDIANGHRVSLVHRGDGVQSIHIPAILKFIAEKDNEALFKKSVPFSTFWGYEEPENGLELQKCYEMAGEFEKLSNSIQIFITTHSPAFYSLSKRKECQSRWVVKDDDGFTSLRAISDINNELGYMPIIEPYITEKIREINIAKDVMRSSACMDMDTIFVEGKTDEKYLEQAIKTFSASLTERLQRKTLRIYASERDGGTSNVLNNAHAWGLCNFKNKKLYVLLDNDEAGRKAESGIRALNLARVQCSRLPLTEECKQIFGKIVEQELFAITVEMMFPIAVWDKLKDKGLLQLRAEKTLARCFSNLIGMNTCLNEAIEKNIPNELQNLVRYEPNSGKKKKIMKFLLNEKEDPEILYKGFCPIVKKLDDYFTC